MPKAAANIDGPTELELQVHKSLLRKLSAQKAAETRRRRYKTKLTWKHPLGRLYHGVPKEDVNVPVR